MVLLGNLRRHFLPVLFLSATLILIFWKVFTLEQAFLSGDHREQQYPWAKFYQEQIREGVIPWWTTRIHAGFPIAAEGQMGAFYPINFLTFLFLPTKIAYNYGILFHYFLGALFFYAFLRLLKRSRWACVFASLVFLYGSSQGGYFYYNYISQKVVIWLPLALILMEKILKKPRASFAFFLALVFSIEVFAGYLQVALYAIFYSSVYFLIRWFELGRRGRPLLLFLGAAVLGILISLVQLVPTLELSLFSSRAQAAKEIAYIGSMTPAGFLTLFYPSWDGFLGSEWYVGILGLLFFIWSFKMIRDADAKVFFMLSALFLLLALGEWSPLYRLIIEFTGFGGFRTPIKFLFFVTFSMGVLIAFGWDAFWKRAPEAFAAKPTRLFLFLLLVAIFIPPLSQKMLEYLRPVLVPRFESFVSEKFYGKPGHPHSEEQYRRDARVFYEDFTNQLSVSRNTPTRVEWGMLAAALLLVLIAARLKAPLLQKSLLVIFLLLDLSLYGRTSIRPNLDSFAKVDDSRTKSPIVSFLEKDASIFRITELASVESQSRFFPVFPSLNMIYGIDDLGAYSPLIMKSYKNFLRGWGGTINDSFEAAPVEKERMLSSLPNLQRLNVKYILSFEAVENPLISEKIRDSEAILYELKEPLPRAFFSPFLPESVDEVKGPGEGALIRRYGQQEVVIDMLSSQKGFLLLSDISYPGWKVWVDGKPQPVLSWAKIFRAVEIPPGAKEIIFRYAPAWYGFLGWMSLGIVGAGFFCVVFQSLRTRRYEA